MRRLRCVKGGKELMLQSILSTVTIGGGVNCSANRNWLVIQTNMQAESHTSPLLQQPYLLIRYYQCVTPVESRHHQLPGHFARLYSVQTIRSLNGRTDMVQVMQRKHQFWCALKCTERTSLPICHSYLQTQLWSNRMNQMDASTRWGTEVLPIARSLHSATEQDGANRDLDRGAVPPCRRRNIQTWHVWKHTAMQEYTEITGTTMFKGREMLPSGELSAPFQPAVIHTMNTTREHAQARHCSRDLPPVGGKWHNRMQFHSLTQEQNPAEAALPELCQLHT